ncbi:hypothetical protein J421_3891 [Gemmatirosa kalamazoonensis]|uniref:PBS lyase HEAT domain protein repeat-containing protein n=1 Tax=Gemmatirosa kalamazoonensis TaxID=861299 RepID=W0RPK8_9BACT|nr:hypothetical protein [Gemmatirosa kalamazoonensis]AHG91428.1 hypothetical protein J421_3891 [Gemmatirosa kalamazoonensis]
MNAPAIDHSLSVARDAANPLPERVAALEALARRADPELLPGLRALWERERPAGRPGKNFDPAADERIVDLHLVRAIAACGDTSLLPEIASLVARGAPARGEQDDERRHAAAVIRAIGRPDPVGRLVSLAARGDPREVANAVRTLQLLALPAPASGGPVPAFAELSAPVSFTIHRLREEVETIARLSGGRIAVSSGAAAQIAAQDYDRGEVRREGTTLATVLERELDLLDLAYAVGPEGVEICTFAEAAVRWQRWWSTHASALPGASSRDGATT